MLTAVLSIRIENQFNAVLNQQLTEDLGKGIARESADIQIYRVCSFQVLSEAFKDAIGSRKVYLRFKHDFLSYLYPNNFSFKPDRDMIFRFFTVVT